MSHPNLSEPIAVVGAGYVGLVTAVGLSSVGHEVGVVEKRPDRLDALRAGHAPFHEPGLQERLRSVLDSGRLSVLERVPDGFAGIVLVCVGTPIGDDGRSDLSQLRSVMADLGGRLADDAVLVIRSTTPIGTASDVVSWSGLPASRVLLNPEFLRQGRAIDDFDHPSQIVVGHFPSVDPAALRRVEDLYASTDAPRYVVDATAAEVIKNGANAFLALKLSFANEIASLCEEAGTDVGPVLDAIGADPRIGRPYMQPSFGFGGSCLPKELLTLAIAGLGLGLPMHVTTAASTANRAQQVRFAGRIASRLGGLDQMTIGVLGLAFKSDTDDVRSSPSLDLVRYLIAGGARVRAYDPAAGANAVREVPEIELVVSASEVFDDADAVVVATEWAEFRTLPGPSCEERCAGRWSLMDVASSTLMRFVAQGMRSRSLAMDAGSRGRRRCLTR